MSVNWSWKDKVGEIDVTYNKGTKFEFKKTLNIYNANCLGCWLDEKEEEYEFKGFFGDEGHMKRCLGLIRCNDGTKSNMCREVYGQWWDEVRLDSSWHYANVWSRNLVKAKMRVVIDNFIEKEGWNK